MRKRNVLYCCCTLTTKSLPSRSPSRCQQTAVAVKRSVDVHTCIPYHYHCTMSCDMRTLHASSVIANVFAGRSNDDSSVSSPPSSQNTPWPTRCRSLYAWNSALSIDTSISISWPPTTAVQQQHSPSCHAMTWAFSASFTSVHTFQAKRATCGEKRSINYTTTPIAVKHSLHDYAC